MATCEIYDLCLKRHVATEENSDFSTSPFKPSWGFEQIQSCRDVCLCQVTLLEPHVISIAVDRGDCAALKHL